jgi:hypothetical protein
MNEDKEESTIFNWLQRILFPWGICIGICVFLLFFMKACEEGIRP